MDGYSAADLIVVSGTHSDTPINDFQETLYTEPAATLVSTSITAPVAGYLLITGSVYAEDDLTLSGDATLRLRMMVDATAVHDDTIAWLLHTDNATGNKEDSTSMTFVVPVTAGAHTVALQAIEVGGGSYIYLRSVTATFSPFGSGSTIPQGTSGAPVPGNS